MKKVFFCVLFFCLNTLSSAAAEQEAQQLKIGFIAPFSGAAAAYGTACRNGFEMALSENSDLPIKVYYEDDQYVPAKAVSALKKLHEVHKVDLLLSMASTVSNAVAPLAERAATPLIAWANDPKVARGRHYVIISEQSAELEGQHIATEVARRGYNSIAFVRAAGDYQQAVSDGFLAALPAQLLAAGERSRTC